MNNQPIINVLLPFIALGVPFFIFLCYTMKRIRYKQLKNIRELRKRSGINT
jgi:hypothetical protein